MDFINIFIKMLTIKSPKYADFNNYIINLKISKQLPYKLIYTLKFIKLKTFKTYIKTNLSNIFI